MYIQVLNSSIQKTRIASILWGLEKAKTSSGKKLDELKK